MLPALGWFLLAALAATGLGWWPLFFFVFFFLILWVNNMGVFKINPAATVVVCIEWPAEDGNTSVLEIKCKYLARAEREAWLKRFESVPAPTLLLEIALGWNVAGDDGAPLPLDLIHLQRLLEAFDGLDTEWLAVYVQACVKARAKN